jgi:hypothetical protein
MTLCSLKSKYLDLDLYYEEIKPELKRILTYECRCNERLKIELRDLHVSHTLSWCGELWNT